jgi:hypothetical protein
MCLTSVAIAGGSAAALSYERTALFMSGSLRRVHCREEDMRDAGQTLQRAR